MKKVILMLLLVATSTCANAGVTMFGTYDCAQWFIKKELAKSWLLGYLSGLASMDDGKSGDVLDRLNSAEQAYLWMDNYCKANPLNTIGKGGNALYLELQRRK